MKRKIPPSTIWHILIAVSLSCYGYLQSLDTADYSVGTDTQQILSETEDNKESSVLLPDVALVRKVFDLAINILRR